MNHGVALPIPRWAAAGLVLLTATAGCRSGGVQTDPGPSPETVGPPATAEYIPVGLEIAARLDRSLSTDSSRVGEPFNATVTRAILARNGVTLIPEGATIDGVVTALDASDRIGEIAYIRLGFERIRFNRREYPFSAEVVDTDVQVRDQRGGQRSTAETAAIGAAAGAVLGAVIGGDLEDAVTGAAIGAAAGTAISLGTGQVDAVLPAGTALTLRVTERVDLR